MEKDKYRSSHKQQEEVKLHINNMRLTMHPRYHHQGCRYDNKAHSRSYWSMPIQKEYMKDNLIEELRNNGAKDSNKECCLLSETTSRFSLSTGIFHPTLWFLFLLNDTHKSGNTKPGYLYLHNTWRVTVNDCYTLKQTRVGSDPSEGNQWASSLSRSYEIRNTFQET